MKYTKEEFTRSEVVELFEEFVCHQDTCSPLELRNDKDDFLHDKGLIGLEVGKWYKVPEALSSCLFSSCLFYFEGSEYSYGFWNGEWWESISTGENGGHRRLAIPATDEEVKQALIKEAKKRGFKEGATVGCLVWAMSRESEIEGKYPSGVRFEYWSKDNELWVTTKGGKANNIFHNGKWATIIDEPNKGISNMSPKCFCISDEPKELTVEQIQKELGYKIKIVE